MSEILLIEDSTDIQEVTLLALEDEFNLTTASNLAEATQTLESKKFDLILLDIGLPDGDGLRYFATLQDKPALKNIPVIFLTGRSDINSKVTAFSLGGQDFIEKPFHPLELKARVKARLVQRGGDDAGPVYNRGNLRVDTEAQRAYLTKDGEESSLELTPSEFRLLNFFLKHVDETIKRDEIIVRIWGPKVHVVLRTVDTHLSNLRKKLTESEYQVESIYGVGYKCVQKMKNASRAA